jgi:hypothetical protein
MADTGLMTVIVPALGAIASVRILVMLGSQ